MRWRNPRRSGNIEDRRGMRVPMKAIGGGIGGLIVLILTLLLSGGDPGVIFDEKVYIDLSFYRDLRDTFGAPGDFAQAYIIAHEVGHHVQNQIGIMQEVNSAQQQANNQVDANRLSVSLELQADCFAGVWAYNADRARDILEQGDIEEGLNAASSIGDDRLQMESQGQVTPDSFTHGSSVQRVSWFERGLEAGDINSCNSFEVTSS